MPIEGLINGRIPAAADVAVVPLPARKIRTMTRCPCGTSAAAWDVVTFYDSHRPRALSSPAAEQQARPPSRRQSPGALLTTAAAALSTGAMTDPPRRQPVDRSATTYQTASRSRTTCFSACGRPSPVGVGRRGWSLTRRRGYGATCVDRGGRHYGRLR